MFLTFAAVYMQMVREIERRGEDVGIDAKSAILAGLSLAGRLNEALTLYETIKKEGVFPLAYSVSALLVSHAPTNHLRDGFSLDHPHLTLCL